jgi:hypothetical protein
METIHLEPCPFCGHTLLEVRELNGLLYTEVLPVPAETSPVFYWVYCRSCNAGGPLANNRREARLLWNTGIKREKDAAGSPAHSKLLGN